MVTVVAQAVLGAELVGGSLAAPLQRARRCELPRLVEREVAHLGLAGKTSTLRCNHPSGRFDNDGVLGAYLLVKADSRSLILSPNFSSRRFSFCLLSSPDLAHGFHQIKHIVKHLFTASLTHTYTKDLGFVICGSRS
jgi:hypothetical protein